MYYIERWVFSAVVLIFIGTAWPQSVIAQPSADGNGITILTITGEIKNTNRGAFNAIRDGFFKHHDIEFDKAYGFDMKMLDSLPQGEVRARPPQLGAVGVFRGPKLKDVLAHVGADVNDEGTWIKIMGLDGFAQEFMISEITDKSWIVATRLNGAPLTIGQQGPLWVLFQPEDPEAVTEAEEGKWPWAVFYMQISLNR